MKEPFSFVWMLGNGSRWQNNEIRYSIRSVLMYHPNASICIIGSKPSWYQGDHVPFEDFSDFPQVNKWMKIEKACQIFDQFIMMDDDFYLLEPFIPVHYRYGPLVEYMKGVDQDFPSDWEKVVMATYKIMSEADRHLLHVPLPIISASFMEIANRFEERFTPPSLVPRQIYCHYENRFEIRDLPHKVKTSTFEPVKDMPFFSIGEVVTIISKDLLRLYPEPTEFENDITKY